MDPYLVDIIAAIKSRKIKNIVCVVGAGISTNAGLPDYQIHRTTTAPATSESKPASSSSSSSSSSSVASRSVLKSLPLLDPSYAGFCFETEPPRKKKDTEEDNDKGTKHKNMRNELFSEENFRKDPQPFYEWIYKFVCAKERELYPTTTHKFLAFLQKSLNVVLRVYTQNFDDLEYDTGLTSSKIVQCHGTISTASCSCCSTKNSKELADYFFAELTKQIRAGTSLTASTLPTTGTGTGVATGARSGAGTGAGTPTTTIMPEIDITCEICDNLNTIRPDIIFMDDDLSTPFLKQWSRDKEVMDLLIVIGTSLSINPMSTLVNQVYSSVPMLLLNRELVHDWNDECALERPVTEDWNYKNRTHVAPMLAMLDDCDVSCTKLQLALTSPDLPKKLATSSSSTIPRTESLISECHPVTSSSSVSSAVTSAASAASKKNKKQAEGHLNFAALIAAMPVFNQTPAAKAIKLDLERFKQKRKEEEEEENEKENEKEKETGETRKR